MNIGFVSTRLAGTDGVTLETLKWARVCRELGHSTFFCAGELDPAMSPGVLVPEAHFTHPEIMAIQQKCLGVRVRSPETTGQIHELRHRLKASIAAFVTQVLGGSSGAAKRARDSDESSARPGAHGIHCRNRHSHLRAPSRFLLGTATVRGQCGARHLGCHVPAQLAEHQTRRHQLARAE